MPTDLIEGWIFKYVALLSHRLVEGIKISWLGWSRFWLHKIIDGDTVSGARSLLEH